MYLLKERMRVMLVYSEGYILGDFSLPRNAEQKLRFLNIYYYLEVRH